MSAEIIPFPDCAGLNDQIDREIAAFMLRRGQPYLETRREHVSRLLGDCEFDPPEPPKAA